VEEVKKPKSPKENLSADGVRESADLQLNDEGRKSSSSDSFSLSGQSNAW